MSKPEISSRRMTSLVRRYGMAVVSVSIAIGLGFLSKRFTPRDVEFAFFLFAVVITVWYAGTGPSVLAIVLSGLSVAYSFTEPLYSLYIEPADIPYLIIIAAFALLIAGFSSIRRRIDQELRESRDKLEIEVAERARQASLLNLTHDTIFVRDMSDVMTYWNRGAQELFGWTAKEAIGKHAHQLLQTVFPMPIDAIDAELLRAGRWEGELEKIKADGTRVVVSSRWSLVRDAQERPVAILTTNNDITQRKRTENHIRKLNEALEKRGAELEATNRELEAFAYSVSHDLRAPLRHMVGYTEFYCRGNFKTRANSNPAVLLLDLKLPKVNGLEVLQQVKSDEKLRMVPVVVLTSSREERDMVASYKLGVNAYVVKPVDFHEFVNAIKELGIFWAIINEPPPGSVGR